jgi:uncharacterized repeat protein (TIGR03837 family)
VRWDIFCHVVDNFGDIGVSWRLARQLATAGQHVRLWTDDDSALRWMAPRGAPGVAVHRTLDPGPDFEPGDVVVSAFGSEIAPAVIGAIGRVNQAGKEACRWVQLEYLSAESYVATSHGLPSPVHGGAQAGIRKWFFFPGFTPDTGGLLREPGLLDQRASFVRGAWLQARGIPCGGEMLASMLCYEPAKLAAWLQGLGQRASLPVRLLVTAGRATRAVQVALAGLPAHWNPRGAVRFTFLDYLAQDEFDRLLWSCDCNFVRGEDSPVRSLWAGAAMVWQLYPQSDDAHRGKLLAFLDWLEAPPCLRAMHLAWNDLDDRAPFGPYGPSAGELPQIDWDGWRGCIERARQRLLDQEDLVTRLLRFLREKR